MMLLLDPTPLARGLARKTADVVNYPDGRFAVQFEGVSLLFRKFDKVQTVEPGEIVENKRLGASLATVKQHQDTYEPHRRRYPSRSSAAAEKPGSVGPADKGTAFPRARGCGGGRARGGAAEH
jgi:hypothetical protein